MQETRPLWRPRDILPRTLFKPKLPVRCIQVCTFHLWPSAVHRASFRTHRDEGLAGSSYSKSALWPRPEFTQIQAQMGHHNETKPASEAEDITCKPATVKYGYREDIILIDMENRRQKWNVTCDHNNWGISCKYRLVFVIPCSKFYRHSVVTGLLVPTTVCSFQDRSFFMNKNEWSKCRCGLLVTCWVTKSMTWRHNVGMHHN